ncbi:hypothetical protein CBR_g36598 [Chara braunii]|uniref:Uncharacterized protein n=1 Tax=Chara braunii TaxID=69332 RepID=A0A388JZ67_CHABU|nr:hypothetical protein CBR_g36598 [Chara braunii]|eukprot:GBG63111.1 hypothetical protein CBR_g36598 [Chara braunii]
MVDTAVQEAWAAQAKKVDDGNSQQASRGKGKDNEVSKLTTELKVLKKQIEDMRAMKYDIASLQGSLANLKPPPTRQFISPRILQGKQISEDMLSALQMEDLKRLCAMHNVRYKGMPQTRVALRKIPGLIISDTEDLLDKTETGEEVNGGNHDDEKTEYSESEEDESSSEEVEVEYSEGPTATEDV